jgi:hypothetical protein
MTMRYRLVVAVSFTLVATATPVVYAGTLAAPGAATGSGPATAPAIPSPLDRTIMEVNFPGIALADAIDFLRDVSGTNIFVNWSVVEAAGVSRNTPVTARLFNVPFSKALDVALISASGTSVPLAYSFEDGVITISTEQDLLRNTVTRTYDVRDLVPPAPAPVPKLADGSRNAAGEKDVVAARARRQQAVEALVGSLQKQVDPGGWRDQGGRTGVVKEEAGQLIVTQTPQNHLGVAAHLEQLRRRRTFAAKVSDAVCWAAPFGLLGVLGLLAARRARGERWRMKGRCRKCGYDLRASTGRCPECGESNRAATDARTGEASPVATA